MNEKSCWTANRCIKQCCGSASCWCRSDPTFYFDALPDPNSLYLQLVEMETDPDPDRQALDADPNPAKWCRSDLIRIHITGIMLILAIRPGINLCNILSSQDVHFHEHECYNLVRYGENLPPDQLCLNTRKLPPRDWMTNPLRLIYQHTPPPLAAPHRYWGCTSIWKPLFHHACVVWIATFRLQAEQLLQCVIAHRKSECFSLLFSW